jgi:hypothetical protein
MYVPHPPSHTIPHLHKAGKGGNTFCSLNKSSSSNDDTENMNNNSMMTLNNHDYEKRNNNRDGTR